MQTAEINNFIETYDNLSLEDKEMLTELFQKNLIESKRESLMGRVKEAEQNYQTGKVKKGNVEDMLKDLEDD